MPNLWKRERGQSLVELAIMLPILLIILLGVVDFGRVFYAYVTITNASREGARYGSLHSGAPIGDIRNQVRQEAQPLLDEALDDDIPVEPQCWPDCDPHADTITVTVQFDFATLFFGNLPLVKEWFPADGKIPIRRQAEMPVAPAPPP